LEVKNLKIPKGVYLDYETAITKDRRKNRRGLYS